MGCIYLKKKANCWSWLESLLGIRINKTHTLNKGKNICKGCRVCLGRCDISMQQRTNKHNNDFSITQTFTLVRCSVVPVQVLLLKQWSDGQDAKPILRLFIISPALFINTNKPHSKNKISWQLPSFWKALWQQKNLNIVVFMCWMALILSSFIQLDVLTLLILGKTRQVLK